MGLLSQFKRDSQRNLYWSTGAVMGLPNPMLRSPALAAVSHQHWAVREMSPPITTTRAARLQQSLWLQRGREPLQQHWFMGRGILSPSVAADIFPGWKHVRFLRCLCNPGQHAAHQNILGPAMLCSNVSKHTQHPLLCSDLMSHHYWKPTLWKSQRSPSHFACELDWLPFHRDNDQNSLSGTEFRPFLHHTPSAQGHCDSWWSKEV